MNHISIHWFFVIRILALFETRINIEFTFDLFNQLTFDSVDWEFTAEDLNDETFFWTVVSEATSGIETTFDLSSIVAEIQSEYEALIVITKFNYNIVQESIFNFFAGLDFVPEEFATAKEFAIAQNNADLSLAIIIQDIETFFIWKLIYEQVSVDFIITFKQALVRV